MTNRKKRLEKGIESIQKQIEEHKLKRERALEEGKLELADYYGTEIEGLEKSQEKKKRMVGEYI
jgi:phage shock protein A